MQKQKRSSFNDGIIGVYSEKDSLFNTDFNAKTNAKKLSDFNFVCYLYFKEQSKRQEDFLFAEAMGKNLTWKIKTPLVDCVEVNHKVIYNNKMFDIINLDPDKLNKELYIYLEGGRSIEE